MGWDGIDTPRGKKLKRWMKGGVMNVVKEKGKGKVSSPIPINHHFVNQ